MLVSETDKVGLLRDVPTLACRTESELARLAAHMDEVEIRAGAVLAPQSGPAFRLCIVLDGEARVCRSDGSTVADLGPRQFLAEATPDAARSSRVVALTPLRLLLLQSAARPRRAATKGTARLRPCPERPQSPCYPDATDRQPAYSRLAP